jgi:hypothetical protein
MTERLLTYAEMEVALGRTPEAVRQLVKRRRWRRTIGNDGKARIAVPEDFLEANTPDDTATTVPTTPERHPAAPEVIVPAPVEPTGDARALLDMLQARIAELDGEVKEARATVTILTARAEVLDALFQAEQRRAQELAADRDRWHGAATATPPGFLARLRLALG